MTNGYSTIKSFEDYKKLTEEQKEFYNFEQLSKIDNLYNKVTTLHSGLDAKYSKKWVERGMVTVISLILVAFIGALITSIIPN